MDGITALSLAVNIIQVVIWGRQVLKGGEIYETQRDAATNFRSATGSLQKQLLLQPQPITAEDQSLLQIAQKCETAGDKLLKELGPTDDANKLKLAMKALFKRPGIKKLEEDFAFCQRVLETQLLVGMKKNIDLTALRMDQNFDNLSDGVQNLALKMEDGKTELSQILDDQTKRMRSLENQSADIATAISNLQVGTSFRKLNHDHPQVHLLLSSLLFPTMFSRRDQIPSTYPNTYKWALKSPKELNQDHHPSAKIPNLLEWLREGDGLY